MAAELLSPAGDFDTALAAFAAGADAVYCGLADFSARAFAKNLSFEELDGLVRYARANGKKVYVTFNTLLDEDAVEGAVETLARLAEIGPDALIIQDLGIARICRRHFPELALHASTQLVAHNLEGVLALGELGFTRVVLARELSLAEISTIAQRCRGIELECFIHGALCYSISGLCLFSAMEKDRSGNRGKCAYCCRGEVEEVPEVEEVEEVPEVEEVEEVEEVPEVEEVEEVPEVEEVRKRCHPFSMKDLRLGADARKLVDAGVASLKIEGRMKSALYVASVTRFYRQILDGTQGANAVTQADLETVFSRRTTELRFDRPDNDVIDETSLGHLGTPIGSVKRVTRDREGLRWLRFHTSRALEKHDGLQFAAPDGGKPFGLGISEMRQAISRVPVFEVAAGTDVEVLLPDPEKGADGKGGEDPWKNLKTGSTIYCAMSNAVKRMFPQPSFRPSDYAGNAAIDVKVTLSGSGIEVASAFEQAAGTPLPPGTPLPLIEWKGALEAAKNPEKTYAAIEKAFSKLGGTAYRLGKLTLVDTERRFAPMSVLNDLRRDLVEALDAARDRRRHERIETALADEAKVAEATDEAPRRELRVRAGQSVPPGEWTEVIVAVNAETDVESVAAYQNFDVRLGLPVWTSEPDFNRLRIAVRRFLRAGYAKWEASDLATVRMLKELGVDDITADWSLYALNSQALAAVAELGVKRFVASPENDRENLAYLAESGFAITFLEQQSTPLFVSLHRPKAPGVAENATAELEAGDGTLAVYSRDGLWITTKPVPRTFAVPSGATATRIDLSWDAAPAAIADGGEDEQ